MVEKLKEKYYFNWKGSEKRKPNQRTQAVQIKEKIVSQRGSKLIPAMHPVSYERQSSRLNQQSDKGRKEGKWRETRK